MHFSTLISMIENTQPMNIMHLLMLMRSHSCDNLTILVLYLVIGFFFIDKAICYTIQRHVECANSRPINKYNLLSMVKVLYAGSSSYVVSVSFLFADR